jgi:hypothetical protein
MTTAEKIRKHADRLTVLMNQEHRTALDLCEMVELQQELKSLKHSMTFALTCPTSGCGEITSDGEPCWEHAALEAEARYGV